MVNPGCQVDWTSDTRNIVKHMLGVLLWEFAEVGMQASDPREGRPALSISGTTHWAEAHMEQGSL